MRGQRAAWLALCLVLNGAAVPIAAQTGLALPGCEPAPELRRALRERLNPEILDKMKLPERVARERQVLTELLTAYPREIEPYTRLSSLLGQYAPDEYAALRERWVKMAKDNPGGPLA